MTARELLTALRAAGCTPHLQALAPGQLPGARRLIAWTGIYRAPRDLSDEVTRLTEELRELLALEEAEQGRRAA